MPWNREKSSQKYIVPKNVISKAITKLGWGDKLLELIVNGALRGKMSPALNDTGVDTSGMDTAK